MMRKPRDARLEWLFVAVVVVIAMHHLPFGGFIAYPLMLLDTLAHEMGHGLTALLVGGKFNSLALYTDGSGVAHCATPAGWPQALVSAGGLLGPCVAAFVALVLGRWQRGARFCLVAGGLSLFLSLILFVRAGTAWIVLIPVGAAMLWLGLKASGQTARLALLFLATEFSLLVFTRSDYLFTPSATIGGQTMTSDVSNMAAVLGGPYWLWGALVALASLATLAGGLKLYFWRLPPEARQRQQGIQTFERQ